MHSPMAYNGKENGKLKMFISYSHEDKDDRESFVTHLAPFISNNAIKCWYDGMNGAGSSFQEVIQAEMARANVFCLLISPHYLESEACMKELEYAISQASSGTIVIPIILRECSWKTIESIRDLLALPEDGKPVASFERKESAWTYVCEEIMAEIARNSYPSVAPDFMRWKSETEISAVLAADRELTLDDLFVDVDLDVSDLSDGNVTSKTSYSDFLELLSEDSSGTVISGGQQAGKTSLLKRLHSHYVEQQICVPVYIDVELTKGAFNITTHCAAKLRQQFVGVDEKNMSRWKQILLFDNFHKASAKHQRKLVDELLALPDLGGVILVVDDVYNLGVTENLVTALFANVSETPS